MNAKPIIMVQISDHGWTLETMHCACLLARNTPARVVLVKLIPVQHISWLGTEWGQVNFTDQDRAEFAHYQATVEDYGVEFAPLLFQYVTLAEAIAQAAEYVNAQIVFAKLPQSVIPFWTRFQRWSLSRQFARQNRQWIQRPVYDTEALEVAIAPVLEINGIAGQPFH